MFHKHRLEALSDAVVAIAMTLLILDIKAPTEAAPGNLAAALAHGGHEWISFAVTFLLVAIFWTLQHRAFDVLEEAGADSVALTFAFLAAVTVLPFSTSLWGHHLHEHLAQEIYFANQLLIGAMLLAKVEVGRARGRVRDLDGAADLRIRLACMVGMFGFLLVAVPYTTASTFPILCAVAAITVRLLIRRSRKNRAAAASI